MNWTLALRGDSLVVRRPRFPDRVLAPTDRDAFRLDQPYEDMTLVIHLAFARDAGPPTAFRLTTSRVTDLEFTRVEDRR